MTAQTETAPRIQQTDTARQAKLVFAAAKYALDVGDHAEAARLLERWRQLAPRTNISTKGNQ